MVTYETVIFGSIICIGLCLYLLIFMLEFESSIDNICSNVILHIYMTWEQINDNRNVIIGWTITLTGLNEFLGLISLKEPNHFFFHWFKGVVHPKPKILKNDGNQKFGWLLLYEQKTSDNFSLPTLFKIFFKIFNIFIFPTSTMAHSFGRNVYYIFGQQFELPFEKEK